MTESMDTTNTIRNSNLNGQQRIAKPLGGSAHRVLANVVVLPTPVVSANGFGYCATATVKLWGEVVPVRLRCVICDGKLGTFGWEVF